MKTNKLISITLLALVWSCALTAQNTIIKGTFTFISPPGIRSPVSGPVSFGLEQMFAGRISLDINGSAMIEFPNDYDNMVTMLTPSIRYYMLPRGNHFRIWMGSYLTFLTEKSDGEYTDYAKKFRGEGFIIGFRAFFSPARKWFMDLGTGVAYGRYRYTFYESEEWDLSGDNHLNTVLPDPYHDWLTRVVFQMGYVIGKTRKD
ncbi:MAG: DUF3575 domain-containing protein [Bacteroidetes bacterium]|nr:DUF3575 domain-containing protein [Bacteroidota bacterium]